MVSLLCFSCKKNEHSCSNGIFEPEYEEKTDCGGVCPPCDFTPTIIDTFLYAKINKTPISFTHFSLSKTQDWILTFGNDSINIQLNLGDNVNLGANSIKSLHSKATFKVNPYTHLNSGIAVLSEINQTEKILSGFFEAKFVSDDFELDTLYITDGEMGKVKWE